MFNRLIIKKKALSNSKLKKRIKILSASISKLN